MRNINIILLSVAVLLMASCITPRRVNYLQDMTQGSQIEVEHQFEAQVAPFDELTITVSTSQMNQELATPFNSNGENNSYLVDINGDIDFPVLGRLHAAGLTRLELQDTMAWLLKQGGYLNDAFVMVRFKNFKIFVLGNGTGKVLNVPNERCTFLEALALMGGLDNYVRRDRIAVMREVDGRMVMRYLDPRSSYVFSDPFFMLQQNDFIIMEGASSSTVRQELTYWTGLISTLTSMATFILTLAIFRKS